MLRRATLKMRNIKRGDALRYSFYIDPLESLDLGEVGRGFAMDVKRPYGGTPILRFTSADEEITCIWNGDEEKYCMTLIKTSLQMKIPVDIYSFDIETFTSTTDTVTLIDGTMQIVDEQTKRQK